MQISYSSPSSSHGKLCWIHPHPSNYQCNKRHWSSGSGSATPAGRPISRARLLRWRRFHGLWRGLRGGRFSNRNVLWGIWFSQHKRLWERRGGMGSVTRATYICTECRHERGKSAFAKYLWSCRFFSVLQKRRFYLSLERTPPNEYLGWYTQDRNTSFITSQALS